ncbi:hypothetical protein BYT27DRAFT_7258712 [Phlegmacium glaucopus]|nr:hypothetical protein BYT27DRAFT_7258712 [Phlegmacium glaucopus]
MSQPDVAKMRPNQHSKIPVRQVQRRNLGQIPTVKGCPGPKTTSSPSSISMVSNASTSGPASRASMLGSAKGGVGIGHSQLNAAGRDHYHITNNYNYLPVDDGKLPETYRSGQREPEKRTVNDENAQTAKNIAKQEKMTKEPSEGNINGPVRQSGLSSHSDD